MGADARPPRRLRQGLSSAALALAVAVTGCTGDDGDADPTTTSSIPDEAVDGGSVTLGLGGAVVADPVAANPGSPAELMVLDLLHDGLTRADADGEIRPALATSWRHDGTHTTWTFELDPEAAYASGAAITGAEVAASLQRAAAAGPTSLAALRLEAVTAITAPTETTVEVRLAGPVATLPAILAAPELGIVDVDTLGTATAEGDLGRLDLSGSWAVADAEEDLVLERRPERPGHLDRVVLRELDDPTAAYAAFEDGEVDWALVPAAEVEDAVEAYGDDHFAPFHAELFLGLRVAAPPLAQAELRVAIAAAIDREALVADVYEGRADPLASIVPAGVPGHDPDRCTAPCQYDPDGAEAALARAYPDGAVPTVPLDFDDSPTQAALAAEVATQLEAVGIPVELRPRPLEEYKALLAAGGQELFSFGWIGGYASPDAYLAPLFFSVADDNLTGVALAPVDQALVAGRSTDDPEAALKAWAGAEAAVLEAAVVVPLAQFRTQPVVTRRVQDLRHAVDGSVDWAQVWVADAGG